MPLGAQGLPGKYSLLLGWNVFTRHANNETAALLPILIKFASLEISCTCASTRTCTIMHTRFRARQSRSRSGEVLQKSLIVSAYLGTRVQKVFLRTENPATFDDCFKHRSPRSVRLAGIHDYLVALSHIYASGVALRHDRCFMSGTAALPKHRFIKSEFRQIGIWGLRVTFVCV